MDELTFLQVSVIKGDSQGDEHFLSYQKDNTLCFIWCLLGTARHDNYLQITFDNGGHLLLLSDIEIYQPSSLDYYVIIILGGAL